MLRSKSKKEQRCQCQNAHPHEIGVGDAENVAEKIGRKVGHKTGSEISKKDADAHAQRPNHRHRTIFAHRAPTAQPVDAQSAPQGKQRGAQQWRKTEEGSDAHAAQ